jgi:hypothetical protein
MDQAFYLSTRWHPVCRDAPRGVQGRLRDRNRSFILLFLEKLSDFIIRIILLKLFSNQNFVRKGSFSPFSLHICHPTEQVFLSST